MNIENQVIQGNCIEILPQLPKSSVNLVFTSPPYAEQRKGYYESVSTDDYPKFTLEWMNALKPLLKTDGSVIINIREHEFKGVQDPYVLKTILNLIQNGWNWCGKFIWHKTTAPPMGSVNRLRRAYEDLYWFAPTNNPYIAPKALGKIGVIGFDSMRANEVGLAHGFKERSIGAVRSTDVFSVSVHKNKRGNPHPAQFPEELSNQIVKIFCPDDGLVLDPFLGSGTVAVSAKNQGKRYCGIEIDPTFVTYAEQRISQAVLAIPSPDELHEIGRAHV